MPGQENKTIFTRRDFLADLTIIGAGAALMGAGVLLPAGRAAAEDSVKLPPLPYSIDYLEPFISIKTVKIHYGKHHAGYVKKLNRAINGTPYDKMPLTEIIKSTAGKPDKKGIFNNAAQVFNHTFYWRSMTRSGGGDPPGALLAAINRSFGSLAGFRKAFTEAAATQFGSGWAWLAQKPDKSLTVMKTGNADTPLAHGLKPLLTIDVWEHAYYLDYQNRRKEYIVAFMNHLMDWNAVAARLA